MIPKNWTKENWDHLKRMYPKTYMIRLHHVKKVDLSGSRTDKVKAIKDGYWKINEELKSWALENASDEQINQWYKDCI